MTNFITTLFAVLGIASLISIILALPLMILWNLLVPTIFGLTTITFWQALGLNVLSSILFKNTTSTSNDK